MVLAAVESSSASIWAAIIAGIAAVAAITSAVIGWKTYRRAGPEPAWRLDPGADKRVCQLVQTGTAVALDVQITARAEDLEGNPSDDGMVRVDGALTHTELGPV